MNFPFLLQEEFLSSKRKFAERIFFTPCDITLRIAIVSYKLYSYSLIQP